MNALNQSSNLLLMVDGGFCVVIKVFVELERGVDVWVNGSFVVESAFLVASVGYTILVVVFSIG